MDAAETPLSRPDKARNWAKAPVYFLFFVSPGLKSGAIIQEF